jgi:hypothetical protein
MLTRNDVASPKQFAKKLQYIFRKFSYTSVYSNINNSIQLLSNSNGFNHWLGLVKVNPLTSN